MSKRFRRNTRGLALLGTLGAVVWLAPARSDAPAAFDPTGAHVPPEVTFLDRPGTLVVDLVDGSDEADLARVSTATGVSFRWVADEARDEALAIGHVPDLAAAARALNGLDGIEVVEPEMSWSIPVDGGRHPADAVQPWVPEGGPNDPMLSHQWNLRDIGIEAAWASRMTGEGVVVAVVDTGVSQVEDLRGTRVLEGASFVPGVATAADDQGHGTHVAGTIAQSTDNGTGVAGVAPGATILPVKVLSAQGFGSSPWIAAGIDYAVDQGADVINLSLGGGYSAVIHNAIKKARAEGVIVVAAAGNSGRQGVGYPGALDETIGVSAVGPDGQLAPYSSWGRGVDIAAPGGDKRVTFGGVLQDTIDGRGGHAYLEFQGTSMATPHVAGAAALLLGTGMAPDAVERTLLETARGTGFDERYGHGRLDLQAALGKATDAFGRVRFLLGAVLGLLVTQLAGTRPRYQLASAALGGVVAGGLFFVPEALFGGAAFLARPGLEWPAAFLGSWLLGFPGWLSAGLTGAVGFTLGAFRPTRPWAQGLAAGSAAYFFHAAATGAVQPWLIPSSWAALWLAGNATLCVLVALALAGAQTLDEQELTR